MNRREDDLILFYSLYERGENLGFSVEGRKRGRYRVGQLRTKDTGPKIQSRTIRNKIKEWGIIDRKRKISFQ